MVTSTQIGHGLAKVLGIKLDYRDPTGTANDLTRGESTYTVESADTFIEEEPTSAEWLRSVIPTGHTIVEYVKSLFPFLHWITRYNLQWLYGDLVAGITIGAVVVPQGMAYAKLALLSPEYGLYSSFMGVLIYWFFATSKDITIGPVAVLSTLTGNIVTEVVKAAPQYKAHPEIIASALAIVAGGIVCFIGLIRLGWIVEFISLASISAFMTGSALNIAVGQVPGLLGIPSTTVDNRASTYLVVINVLKHLNACRLDAAIGLTALAMLYLIRIAFNWLAKRQPQRRKLWFFCSTLRTVFVILLYTLISWLCNMHIDHAQNPLQSRFSILGNVPRGFQHARVPTVNAEIINLFVSQLPVTVIVLLIEHISISKSFGRVNNYTINPSQEMVAIGVSNLLGPFLGAYPATGSFSRTAIKSKAGVRTPFAGVITAVVVLLAIYALTAVFFYIPNAGLSAVIIHAVGDLITPPNTLYQFWRVSPIEVLVFFAGVIVTVFTNIENGVYVTIATSFALLVWRMFKAKGRFLGRVTVHSVVGDHLIDSRDGKNGAVGGQGRPDNDPNKSARSIFIPMDHGDGSNPDVRPEQPYPGVFIYRFSEGYNYPNANHYLDYMTEVIFKETQRTNPHSYPRPGDRPWNDPGPRRGKEVVVDDTRPTLKAIILDFSSVNNVDITSVQHLIDVRNQLDRYTTPDRVQWHFACINNRWTKRALAAAGFGYPALDDDLEFHRWKPVFSVAEIGGDTSAAAAAEAELNRQSSRVQQKDEEQAGREIATAPSESGSSSRPSFDKQLSRSVAYNQPPRKVAVVQGLNRPYFHVDLTSALQSAINAAERLEADHVQRVQREVTYSNKETEVRSE